ncbi:hypothetical protein SSCG_05231 [Streptomyces clavuligerus]|nr:hypothetical protein SSCG_05231 [Streptomyces clavuligerus]
MLTRLSSHTVRTDLMTLRIECSGGPAVIQPRANARQLPGRGGTR